MSKLKIKRDWINDASEEFYHYDGIEVEDSDGDEYYISIIDGGEFLTIDINKGVQITFELESFLEMAELIKNKCNSNNC